MSAAKLLPRHHDEFRSKEYWDAFFQERKDAFEWYGEYEDLRKLVRQSLQRTDRILVVGCGNSNFSPALYDDGFEEVENVDFSQPVVADMCRAHSRVRPRMTWRVMDVTDMAEYEDGSFDAVVDKGTLDALMSEDTPEVRESGSAMLREVARILKPGGRYMCVTLWQDFIGSTFLESFARDKTLAPASTVRSGDAAATTTNEGDAPAGDAEGPRGSTIDLHSAAAGTKPSPYLPVCVIVTKASSSSPLAEEHQGGGPGGGAGFGEEVSAGGEGEGESVVAWCDRAGRPLPPGEEPFVLAGEREVLTHVREAQQMHRRRFDLRELRPGRFEQEDLWGEGNTGSPRLTLFILDVSGEGHSGLVPCAVVIIPRGRDRDFTFLSREGLEQVAQSANARRLIAVRLNRGHDFSAGMEGVRAEISPVVSDFAPKASTADTGGPGIPIMAVSDSLGVEGRVVAEGHLECSGNFVVEEEEEEEEEDDEDRPAGVYRRLIFLKNQGVVQTEVRLLDEDEDDGVPKSALRKLSSKAGGKKGKGKGKGGKAKRASAAAAAAAAAESDDEGRVRVDASHLCFEFHRYMVAGAAFADFRIGGGETGGDHRAPTALVIGLGGGALPMALRRMYPSLKVVTVEIDPDMPGIAKEHFGLKESDDCKVVVEDGLAFVTNAAAAAAAAAAAPTPGEMSCEAEVESSAPSPETAPSIPAPPVEVVASESDAAAAATPPPPPEANRAAVEWGGAFGPPYSAIFLDVDSKDTSVGMSCPPAAFLEAAFLANLKTLLHGGGQAVGGAGGAGKNSGVLAINVAARSQELFSGAMDAVCKAFPDGEVHKLRATQGDVNAVVFALPRPRPRARSGPLFAVAEQALASATVPRKAVASILEVCERAETVQLGHSGKSSGSNAKHGSKGCKRRTGGR